MRKLSHFQDSFNEHSIVQSIATNSSSNLKFKRGKYVSKWKLILKLFTHDFPFRLVGSMEIIFIRSICNMILTFPTAALPINVHEKEKRMIPMKNSQKYRWDDINLFFRSTSSLWEIFWPKRGERKHPLLSYWQRFLLARQWRWNLGRRRDVESLIFNVFEKGWES